MKNKLAYTLAIIVALVYLAFGITIVFGIYSNGFESMRTLYAKTGGKVIKNTVMIDKEFVAFELKNAGFASDKWGDYTITVTSNPACDCTYKVNGKDYVYTDLDFSDVILTRKIEGGFILRSPGSLKNALEDLYNREVILKENNDQPPFTVNVKAENGKNMSFMLGFEEAESQNTGE